MSSEGKPVLERSPEEIAEFRDELLERVSNSERADYTEFCKKWAQDLTDHLESVQSK